MIGDGERERSFVLMEMEMEAMKNTKKIGWKSLHLRRSGDEADHGKILQSKSLLKDLLRYRLTLFLTVR